MSVADAKNSKPLKKAFKKPTQARSKARVKAIMDAAERLLDSYSPEEIGPYEIAKEAEVPPASIYYFFPAIEDLWAELTKEFARRPHLELLKVTRQASLPVTERWQVLFELGVNNLVDFYNDHPAQARLVLGPNGSREVCASFDQGDVVSARISERVLRQRYILPPIPRLRQKLVNSITAAESLMRKGYRLEGYISEEYKKEAALLAVTYLRTLLPEELQLRD